MITIDFESDPIERRPNYPPIPKGLAIHFPGETKKYYAWDHPTENNCSKEDAARQLTRAWKSGDDILFHHSKFDLDVAETHFGMAPLPWERTHDTEYLLFLDDPHAKSLSLKPSAKRLLGMEPEEQDAVHNWLIDHGIVKKNEKEWGKHICKAPGKLVGKYAIGDLTRTKRLYDYLIKRIRERNMEPSYIRERKLMPILLRSEREGVRVDVYKLLADYKMYLRARDTADNWLRKQLRAPNLDFNKKEQLAEVLNDQGVVTEWTYTEKAKKRSVAKKSMTIDKFTNRKIALVYAYRARLQTCLSTFFEPWRDMALESDGWIYTNWNQVRQAHGNDNFAGARTGRLSSNPNLQNIPTDFENKDDGFKFEPWMAALGLPPLPMMRRYLLPDVDAIWLCRDYNQQELRMTAHFENGRLMEHYQREPRFDIHTMMQKAIKELIGLSLSRTGTKIVNFSDIYGRGLAAMAESLHIDMEMAKLLKKAKKQLMPDVDDLMDRCMKRGRKGLAIRTWGGREYYCEKSGFSKKLKKFMTFEYKLLNYLIQGSCSELTKESLIIYDALPHESRFTITVHDEDNASTPGLKRVSERAKRDFIGREMEVLRVAMEEEAAQGLDVPFLTDGKTGPNWADLQKFVEPEKTLAATA